MDKLHKMLLSKSRGYARWHANKNVNMIHLLILTIVASAATQIILSEGNMEMTEVIPAQSSAVHSAPTNQ